MNKRVGCMPVSVSSNMESRKRLLSKTAATTTRSLWPSTLIELWQIPRLGKQVRLLQWVKGCRRDHVGITTALCQIAADLLRSPSRQSRARSGRHQISVAPPRTTTLKITRQKHRNHLNPAKDGRITR